MDDKKINKKNSYTINLVEIGGKGDFKCPGCGVKISPDDKTEDKYIILEPVMKKDNLQKLLIQCNNCKSHINLLGFERLQ